MNARDYVDSLLPCRMLLNTATTGLSTGKGAELIAVSLARFSGGEYVRRTLYRRVPAEKLEPGYPYHGLTAETLEKLVSDDAEWNNLLETVGQCPVVTYNVPFQRDFLESAGMYFRLVDLPGLFCGFRTRMCIDAAAVSCIGDLEGCFRDMGIRPQPFRQLCAQERIVQDTVTRRPVDASMLALEQLYDRLSLFSVKGLQ